MALYAISGGGLIGSHLADYLLAEGHDVRILGDPSTGKIDNGRHHAIGQMQRASAVARLDAQTPLADQGGSIPAVRGNCLADPSGPNARTHRGGASKGRA